MPTGAPDELETDTPDRTGDQPTTPNAPKAKTEKTSAGRPDIQHGRGVIRDQIKTLPDAPGVYRMLDIRGDVLYVGKAKSLKKRVASYTRLNALTPRLLRMVSETRSMEIVTTRSEGEALLLESNLIKKLKPRFNILLRDDKSFPYILFTGEHEFPQLVKHRGARDRKGEYFGPFASAGAVNETLALLEKAFLLRTCGDSVFANRTRPCLKYQIKRCSAPCVGKIDAEGYRQLIDQARAFMRGRSGEVRDQLTQRMQAAAEAFDYETAAVYRDRIRALARVHTHQGVNLPGLDDVDVIAGHSDAGQTCIQVFFFRGGQNYGTRSYFPAHQQGADLAEVMDAFIGQFYTNKPPPKQILINTPLAEPDLMAEALAVRAGHKVRIHLPRRGAKAEAVALAADNAREALGRRLAETSSQRKLLEGVARVFDLDETPERIEVYDNAHISGSNAVCGMIVAGPEGFDKKSYRTFTIKDVAADAAGGDDYAMMREVMRRRLSRLAKEDPERTRGQWPDLILLDGGRGQLSMAEEVKAELGIDNLTVVGIAKGPDRDAGRERFFMPGREPFRLPDRDPVLYFLQRLRDEAHRFAGGAHRGKRSRALNRSALDEIPGIGPRRKKALLNHFGSARAVESAGIADLEAVDGISKAVARQIHGFLHPDGA